MTELLWDGKYDQRGRKVAPLRVSLPFQTVESVNESAQERQRALDFFGKGRDAEWRNRLIWGDKKYVLPALVNELAGKVDLIHIDPPFFTGDDFKLEVKLDGDAFVKEPSAIERKAYRDTWGVSRPTWTAGPTSTRAGSSSRSSRCPAVDTGPLADVVQMEPAANPVQSRTMEANLRLGLSSTDRRRIRSSR
jgi:hypothetical protein